MPILAMSAGKVTAIWGSAYVRSPDGSLRALHVGDKVAGGEHIVTDDNGLVQISPIKGPAVLVKAKVDASAVDKSIAGIESQDPDQAPAAGLTGGADGGLQPGLRVERVVETVGPQTFEFGTPERTVLTPVGAAATQAVTTDATVAQPEPAPVLSINNVSVNEGAGQAVFTISLDKPATSVVTVSYTTVSDSARETGDFTPVSGTLTFQPGQTTQTISVPLINDAIYEGSERFTVKLDKPVNAVIAQAEGVGEILDDGRGQAPDGVKPDDDRPRVTSVSDAAEVEGGALTFQVHLSHTSTTDTILKLSVLAGATHGATPGIDTSDIQVFLGDGLLSLPVLTDAQGQPYVVLPALTPVDEAIIVKVPTVVDAATEGIETIRLAASTQFDTAPVYGTGTIDDRPYLVVQSGTPATEGQPVEFHVTLSRASDKAIAVKLTLLDGTDDPTTPEQDGAVVGQDTGTQLEYLDAQGQWVPVSGDLVFSPGETLIVVRVATVDDSKVEPTEYVKLQAEVTSGADDTVNLVHANQTALEDNDKPYMLVQSGEPVTEGQPVVFDLVLTDVARGPVTVKLALASGVDDPTTPENESATLGVDTGTKLELLTSSGVWVPLGDDPQVTFEPGQTLIQVRVATVDDRIAEDIEFIKLQGTVVSGETANVTHANQTAVVDNDVLPGVLEPIHAVVSAQDTNLMIVLDTSGSMDAASGIDGLSRMQAAVKAIGHLIDKYDQFGDVAVRLVTFASTSQIHGDAWVSGAQAKQLLAGLLTDGATNYDTALAAAQTAFQTEQGKLANAQNVAYFLSDGNPTLSSAYPEPGVNGQSGNLTQPGKGDGIDSLEEAAWVRFLEDHQIKSHAIGMGGDVTTAFLDPIAHDGQASSDSHSTVVTQFADLDRVLSGTTQDFVQGNLSAQCRLGAAGDAFTRVESITVDGVVHHYDAAHPVLTLHTSLDGVLTVDLNTGVYSYAAPSAATPGVAVERFDFSLLAADGSVASSTLDVRFDHVHMLVGAASDDTLAGEVTADFAMGRDGQDVIQTDGGNDILFGNGGADVLHGGAGDDRLVGGQGADTLFGDAGSDVFVWRLSDAGTAAVPTVDVIEDFDPARPVDQGDVLDLRDLLQGEHTAGGLGNLARYLSVEVSGPDTLIHVSNAGGFTPGGPVAGVETQIIALKGVDLPSAIGLAPGAASPDVLSQLLVQGKLLVDSV